PHPSSTSLYSPSLHDALPISVDVGVEQADSRAGEAQRNRHVHRHRRLAHPALAGADRDRIAHARDLLAPGQAARRADLSVPGDADRKSTRLNSSHQIISYAVF